MSYGIIVRSALLKRKRCTIMKICGIHEKQWKNQKAKKVYHWKGLLRI